MGRRSLVESGRAFAFRDGNPVFQVMLPFHLEFNSQTRLCNRFNSRMALQYVEAVRLAADLVQNSLLLGGTKYFGNESVGFIIMDTCSSVDHVMEHLKAMQFEYADKSCRSGLLCPWSNSSQPDLQRHTIQKSALRLVIGIESSAIVNATERFLDWIGIPLFSHAASRQPFSRRTLILSTRTGKRQLARRERHVFRVFPEAFEARAILDLIAFFKWTLVGVFVPLTEEATAMYSNLEKNINTRTCFGIQVTYSTKDEESVFDAAEKIANVSLINAVIFLGDLESSLPFIRAVSDLNAIDRLVWIMTSTWGKQAWGLPLNNSKYQVVAKMKHVFFLQPVPVGKKSVLGVSWQSIACKLQERLRNANRQSQENNPWFKKSMTAATSSFFEDDEVEDRNQGLGMLGAGFGAEYPEDRACSLRKDSFFLDNSLLLIDSFLQTARTVGEILNVAFEDPHGKYVDSSYYGLQLVTHLFSSHPDWPWKREGWFHLTDSEMKQLIRTSNLNNWGLFKNFSRGTARSNLTGLDLDPRNAKYSIYFMRRSEEIAVWPSKFGHWIPSKVIHTRHLRILEIKAEMANILSSCPYNITCPPGTRKVAATFANYVQQCCSWKTCAPCTGNSYSSTSNSAKCTECERGHPSKDHTTCQTGRTSTVLVLAGIFAAMGFGMAALTLIQFYRHRCAFIVKSSDYMLSMGMLFFFAISFLSVALLLIEPTNSICKTQVVAVLPWPVLYAGCILVKTNQLRVLVRHSSKLSAHKLPILSNQAQGVFIAILAFVTATFLFLWVALDSIEVRIVQYEDNSEKVCSLSNTWMGVYFGGILSLFVTSLILASLTHSIPADFNEASFLLLPTWTTFFWIILIPAYYVSKSVRSDSLFALIITSQGLVTMFCLFTRRLYYIMRPMSEAEVKLHWMSGRSFAQRSQCSNASSMRMPGQALALTRIQTIEPGIDLTTSTQHEERSHKMKPALPAVVVIPHLSSETDERNCAPEVKDANL